MCDALMGSGKTTAAINMMNEKLDQRYFFVTQFLTEVKRIKEKCRIRKFTEPMQLGDGKLGNIRSLVDKGYNIASTHALFYRYDANILESIRKWKYTLVLDEVVDVIEFLEVTPNDIQKMLATDTIAVDEKTRRVTWQHADYVGAWSKLKTQIENSCVTYENDRLMVWMLPVELFTAFDNVIILSYMFKAQLQYYYFLVNNVESVNIGITKKDGQYRLVFEADAVPRVPIPLIHILDDDNLNAIGDKKTNLSSTWFTNQMKVAEKPTIKQLKNNIYNVFSNRWGAKSKEILWSTYNKAQNALRGNGYSKSFLSFNARATNDYRDRKYLAYAVNIYVSPDISVYFSTRGYQIDNDAYALSTMLQWLWRSAIRDGKEVWLYIPSSRMRTLLEDWLNSQ